MKELLRPIPLFALFLAIASMAMGRFAIAGICLVVFIATVALGALRQTNALRVADVADRMDVAARTLFVPIRRLEGEIRETVRTGGENPMMRTVGKEAVAEAKRVRDQAASALIARTELSRLIRGRTLAEQNLARYRQQLAQGGDESLHSMASLAIESHERELAHYASADEAIGRIDDSVKTAQVILSEMRSRLASTRTVVEGDPDDHLREAILKMKSLTVSYDEVKQFLRED